MGRGRQRLDRELGEGCVHVIRARCNGGGAHGARELVCLEQGVHVCVRVLAHDVQKLDEVADDLTRREVRVCAHASKLNLEKAHELRLCERPLIAKVAGMDVRELLDEDEKLLVGEGLQVDDAQSVPG